MPILPKSRKRPWIPDKPEHLREVDNSSFYNSKRWRSLRNYFIQKNPLCNICKRKGITKGAEMVDHIKPITKGGSPVDQLNLQSLCNKCHAKKSGQEGAEFRKGIKDYKRKKTDGRGV